MDLSLPLKFIVTSTRGSHGAAADNLLSFIIRPVHSQIIHSTTVSMLAYSDVDRMDWKWKSRDNDPFRNASAQSFFCRHQDHNIRGRNISRDKQLINENISVSICPAGFSHEWHTAIATLLCGGSVEGEKRFAPIIHTIRSLSTPWQLLSSAYVAAQLCMNSKQMSLGSFDGNPAEDGSINKRWPIWTITTQRESFCVSSRDWD